MVTLSVLVFVVSVLGAVTVFLGNRQVKKIKSVAPLDSQSKPLVSIVVAARNEGKVIREALKSILGLTYPSLELIVVDDRSEDETPLILKELQSQHSKLKITTIKALPPGWLGKNHALHEGAKDAQGEYVLFTDADIHFLPDTIDRAMAYVLEHQLEHLALIPEVITKGYVLPLMISYFTFCFAAFFQPWRAKDPKSKKFIGIGAFNLVKRSTYLSLGGHEKIKLRPDDDLRLGQWLKMNGCRQDVLFGTDFVKVEWYENFMQLFHGLEKNTFAGAGYSLLISVVMFAVTVLFHIAPFFFLMSGNNTVAGLSLITCFMYVAASIDNNRFHRLRSWCAIFFPVSAFLMLVIMIHAVIKTLFLGGIYWRGTFYSLGELKSNRLE